MTAGRARRAAVVTAVVVLAGACSLEQRDDAGSAPDPATLSSTAPEPQTEPPARATEPSRTPLVLAVHPSRGPLDVSLELARRLLAGRVRDWGRLGADADRLRLVGAPGTPVPRELRLADAVTAVRVPAADRAALAVVPATAVGPSVAVVTVAGRHPIRTPSRYPLHVAGEAPGRVTTLGIVGDVMLARRVGASMAAAGDLAAALRPTARRLAAADLTIGNLESTLSRAGAPRQGGDSFGADPRVLQGLRLAGFDVLSLANNHVGDYGPAALVRTVRRVRAGGIVPVGAGADRREAAEPAVVSRGGLRFGVLAFDAIGETPAAGRDSPGVLRVRMQPRTGPLDRADLARVLRAVRALRGRVDMLAVLPHWGTQYTTDTVRDQRIVARALVAAGADLVVGGHPHWVQGVELHRGRLVAYSLGNYVFDMDFSRPTREGVILELTYWGDRLRSAELVPVRTGADFAPRVATGAAGRTILERVWRASGPPLSGSHLSR